VLGDLYVEQGSTLRLKGRAGSSDLYRIIHQLEPSLKEAYVNRGLSYAMLGDPSSAKKDLLTAARADPALAGHVAQMSERFNLDKGDP
jgi:hypothetical protein